MKVCILHLCCSSVHEYMNLVAETEVSPLGDQLVSQLYEIEIQEIIQISDTAHNQQNYITIATVVIY